MIARPAISRAVRVTFWLGCLCAALCAVAFVVSLRWYAIYRYHRDDPSVVPAPTPGSAGANSIRAAPLISLGIGLSRGAVRTMRWPNPTIANPPAGWFSGRAEGPVVWWPQGFSAPHRMRAWPLWMIAAAGFTPYALVAARDRLRRTRSACPACGYDLRGLPAPGGAITCPECGGGTTTSRSARAGQADSSTPAPPSDPAQSH